MNVGLHYRIVVYRTDGRVAVSLGIELSAQEAMKRAELYAGGPVVGWSEVEDLIVLQFNSATVRRATLEPRGI